jgi:hypothetical protein
MDIANLLIADSVLPMDVGGVVSAATKGEDTNIEWVERDKEAVESNNDRSLSTESMVLLFKSVSANPF